MKSYEAIIIGFGKGGKTLALEFAKRGKSVALIEESAEMYGGTCVNVGCFPSKSLIMQANRRVPFEEAVRIKDSLILDLRQKNYDKIARMETADVVNGTARFIDDRSVEVNGEELRGEYVFINTGSKPFVPNIKGAKEAPRLHTSSSIMKLSKLPKKLGIIGGGYIGLEFAETFAKFGSDVTVFNKGDSFLPKEDGDVADAIRSNLEKAGVKFLLDANTEEFISAEDEIVAAYDQKGVKKTAAFDAALLATGRAVNTAPLRLERAGVETDRRGNIIVDEYLRTSKEHIFALGDVTGGPMFTYVSLDDYRIVKDFLFGEKKRTTKNRGPIPYSVFITPTFSKVGLGEKEALDLGYEIKTAVMPTDSFPRAKIDDKTEGFMKAVADKKTDEILGCELICERSEEIINLVRQAMVCRISAKDMANTIFTHPTMSEALNELFEALN